jgi:hypothetical protein
MCRSYKKMRDKIAIIQKDYVFVLDFSRAMCFIMLNITVIVR